MFLFRSSAVEGTYSFALVFFFPLLGMNSLTHSPLAAAISLKINKIRFDQKGVNYSSFSEVSLNVIISVAKHCMLDSLTSKAKESMHMKQVDKFIYIPHVKGFWYIKIHTSRMLYISKFRLRALHSHWLKCNVFIEYFTLW